MGKKDVNGTRNESVDITWTLINPSSLPRLLLSIYVNNTSSSNELMISNIKNTAVGDVIPFNLLSNKQSPYSSLRERMTATFTHLPNKNGNATAEIKLTIVNLQLNDSNLIILELFMPGNFINFSKTLSVYCKYVLI